ncbi:hypothetical protein FISHEDRAFT_76892 [Fistulina hepatica ATCC 64428]|uniref:Uncharacterized protein n=1 Tax=Fistulina hepatica ATCC 64428 TaxID=1128425 RepID=A0A0D7A1X9_9AGAR|nr:hypothetical protein FISHEDRAFT_76892 [Fistulina hepatica ATCC 64428]
MSRLRLSQVSRHLQRFTLRIGVASSVLTTVLRLLVVTTETEAAEQGDESDYNPPSSPSPLGPVTARKRPNTQSATVASPSFQAAPHTAPLGDIFMMTQEVQEEGNYNRLVDVPTGVQAPVAVPAPPAEEGLQFYDEPVKMPFPADRDGLPTFAILNPIRLDTSHLVAPDVQFRLSQVFSGRRGFLTTWDDLRATPPWSVILRASQVISGHPKVT